jgi:hypothetical protein
MFGFIKKLFGNKPAETPVPYKVEAPKVEQFPFPEVKAPTKPKAEKKPAVKAKTARKPRSPKV